MPKNSNSIKIECRYFTWRLRLRKNGFWQADSRGHNKINGRRHSLGTTSLDEAKRLVHILDEQEAAEYGLISYKTLFNSSEFNLSVDAGFAAYQEHIERPRAAGGPKPETRKRYGRIMRAFRCFLEKEKIQYCEQISKKTLNEYAAQRSVSCKDSSVKLELIQVRTFLNHLRDEKLLAPETRFTYQTKKSRKTKRRYCPLRTEAQAILRTLRHNPELQWLFHSVMMLINTGLRLGEIAQMTSHDIKLELGVIWVLDEEEDNSSKKETKSGESRFLPITPELRPILEELVTSDDRRLFTRSRGGSLSSETFNNSIRSNALVPFKVRFPHPRFQTITAHCFRHFFKTYATYCENEEADIESWMGHGSSSMSQRYLHSDIESACEKIKKFKPLLSDDSDNQFDSRPREEYNINTNHRDGHDDLNKNPENHGSDTEATNH